MVIYQALEGHPSGLHTKPFADLLGDDDLAFGAYHIGHGMTSL